MADLSWQTAAQIQRIASNIPLSYEAQRVDDQRAVGGTIHNSLRCRDAPTMCSPHKTLWNHFVHRIRIGVFNRIFSGLAGCKGQPYRLLIGAIHLKVHRTAAGLLAKRLFPAMWAHQGWLELQAARGLG
ncbi:hypothetical protein ACFQU7_13120 [Pseudoroseomonas wenyumeiae]